LFDVVITYERPKLLSRHDSRFHPEMSQD
jgi:hypothetical protein